MMPSPSPAPPPGCQQEMIGSSGGHQMPLNPCNLLTDLNSFVASPIMSTVLRHLALESTPQLETSRHFNRYAQHLIDADVGTLAGSRCLNGILFFCAKGGLAFHCLSPASDLSPVFVANRYGQHHVDGQGGAQTVSGRPRG